MHACMHASINPYTHATLPPPHTPLHHAGGVWLAHLKRAAAQSHAPPRKGHTATPSAYGTKSGEFELEWAAEATEMHACASGVPPTR